MGPKKSHSYAVEAGIGTAYSIVEARILGLQSLESIPGLGFEFLDTQRLMRG